ncbi:MAG: AAA family ATPase [Burkholderiaceae bacterium]|nr:AAA family ATPase [Burkholderiaceae bacterium]
MRTNNKDEASGLPGYGGYSFHDEDTYKSITLILPSAVLQTLKDEALAAKLAQEAEESAAERAIKKAEGDQLSPALKPRPSLGVGEFDPNREAADLQQAASGSAETFCAAESVAVYGVLEPLNLVKDLKARTPDREIHKRNEALYRRIKPKGHRRALAQPQVDPLRFDHLRRAFPHFAPVLDLVQDQHAFAELTDKPVQIPPILLGGDPGIGKTRFSVELAKALGTVIRRLPFDNGQSGTSLLGSDKNWANTTYGVVFELVVLGEFANPVILLDEIDKASKRREGDALAALHTLLEPVTSQTVRDISVDFDFNASRVVWIATANDLTRVPQSLRSRFHEFWIEQPTGAQALLMAEVVALEVHQEMNLPDFEPPSRQIAHYIAYLSAREQVQALKRAYAAARVNGRHHLSLADLPEQVRREASELAGDQASSTGLLH